MPIEFVHRVYQRVHKDPRLEVRRLYTAIYLPETDFRWHITRRLAEHYGWESALECAIHTFEQTSDKTIYRRQALLQFGSESPDEQEMARTKRRLPPSDYNPYARFTKRSKQARAG